MTKAQVAKLIQRRLRISQRAKLAELNGDSPSMPVVNYHEGCMVICRLLLDDVREFKERK